MRNPARIAPMLVTSPVAGNSGPGLAGGIEMVGGVGGVCGGVVGGV